MYCGTYQVADRTLEVWVSSTPDYTQLHMYSTSQTFS
jgi:hypothetical protein